VLKEKRNEGGVFSARLISCLGGVDMKIHYVLLGTVFLSSLASADDLWDRSNDYTEFWGDARYATVINDGTTVDRLDPEVAALLERYPDLYGDASYAHVGIDRSQRAPSAAQPSVGDTDRMPEVIDYLLNDTDF
jgi:hypothetical protein